MLRELHIKNLAVIEDASVEFQPGLNVFTGETGAGKSLVIGAFELLLGIRSGGASAGQMVRAGADEARVSGLFELPNPAVVERLGECFDRDLPPGEPLLITRRLFATGRSSASVNGEPVTAGMLRAAGEFLVDIHGQHDQQYLLKPANQLRILDAFADCLDLRERFAAAYETRRHLRDKRENLLAGQDLRRQRIELLEFQADEIDAAEPVADEYPAVRSRHLRLSNLGQLQQEAAELYDALAGQDGATLEQLQTARKHLADLADLDPEHLQPLAAQVAEAAEILQDAAYQLSGYVDDLDLDADELAATEERLDTLNHLAHKYARDAVGEDPIADVLAAREAIGRELDDLRNQQADLSGIDVELARAAAELAEVGQKLSAARVKAAGKLKPLIEAELKQLGMGEAAFEAKLITLPPDDPQAGPAGLDRIELLLRTNPGQDAQPLRHIASGGELSRVMLALKSILADRERISVLVFDEIDANIGGRLGSVIGRKMRQLLHAPPARRSRMNQPDPPTVNQVLCITHLPQIAAFADHHLHIAKQSTGKGAARATRTTVRPLTGQAREAELAEMLAGADYTETALAQARELLAAAVN